MSNIAERLISLRKNKSRRAFAEEIGLKESTLRNYEQGITQPTAEFAGDICKKMRVSPTWLLFGEGQMSLDSVSTMPSSSVEKRREELKAPPIPEHYSISLQILFEVDEAFEEVLQERNSTLSPTARAEILCQLCRLVIDDEAENRRPAKIFRLIKGALAANG